MQRVLTGIGRHCRWTGQTGQATSFHHYRHFSDRHWSAPTFQRLYSQTTHSIERSGLDIPPTMTCPRHLPDSILLVNLTLRGTLGLDSWERTKTQPIIINLKIHSDTRKAGLSDLVGETVNYGSVAKAIEKLVAERCVVSTTTGAEKSSFRLTTVEDLAESIAKTILFGCGAESLEVRVEKPRALLHASSAGVEICRQVSDYSHPSLDGTLKSRMLDDYVFVQDLRLSAIIGVNPWEREEKQDLIITFGVYPYDQSEVQTVAGPTHTASKPRRKGTLSIPEAQNFRVLTRLVTETVEATAYKTVEALASRIACSCILQGGANRIKVRISKPSAIVFAQGAGVEIQRRRSDFVTEEVAEGQKEVSSITPLVTTVNGSGNDHEESMPLASTLYDYYLGLGSNVGNRFRNMLQAIRQLTASPGCTLLTTSHLYESDPMYLEEQDPFLNAVILVRTSLSPPELLDLAKSVEKSLGRIKTIDNGPRPIDIDLLLIEGQTKTQRWETRHGPLELPHIGIGQREFVVRPLLDILPDHSIHLAKYQGIYQNLLKQKSHGIRQIVPWIKSVEKGLDGVETQAKDDQHWVLGKRTFLMGILNVTPDSFSDGGDAMDINSAIEAAAKMVAEGADILDIGGQSTRPNALEVSAEEEMARIGPVIKTIKADPRTKSVLMSIDTFRASVAEFALSLGADMVNDVTGGTRDPKMFKVVAEHGCPICIMHSRGTSSTMTKLTEYDNGVVQEVSLWLQSRAQVAMQAGIPRWNIMLDQGIGFAKTKDQNLQLIRHLSDLVPSKTSTGPAGLGRFPVLLGTSRKQFVGTVTKRSEPKERIMGTSATIVAGIQTGVVDLVRVHDVKEMKESVLMADAIYRVD